MTGLIKIYLIFKCKQNCKRDVSLYWVSLFETGLLINTVILFALQVIQRSCVY